MIGKNFGFLACAVTSLINAHSLIVINSTDTTLSIEICYYLASHLVEINAGESSRLLVTLDDPNLKNIIARFSGDCDDRRWISVKPTASCIIDNLKKIKKIKKSNVDAILLEARVTKNRLNALTVDFIPRYE